MGKLKKTAILLVALLLLSIAGCAPADTEETLSKDYVRYIGTWYSGDDMELEIISVEGNELTFRFKEDTDQLTHPIVDDKVQWQTGDVPEELVFYEESINYIKGDLSYWLMETKDTPYDYSILVGEWYPEGDDESELTIMSAENDELTFSFYGGEEPITSPIIDNRVEWTITSYDGEVFTLVLVIHEEGIDYISGDITTRYIKSVPW